MAIPRPEHPRMQFRRDTWMNLNGTWSFEIDNARSGEARGLAAEGVALSGIITVPFCPESTLSGIGNTDFINGVWYKRKVHIPAQRGRVRLHFGAVDYACKAFVNGTLVGTHRGGYSSFSFDITAVLRDGENEITVYAEDDTRDHMIPSGKQSAAYDSYGCFYTRTTGIWQTVWLEYLPDTHIESVVYHSNIETSSVTVELTLCGKSAVTCDITYEGRTVGHHTTAEVTDRVLFTVPLCETHLWEVGHGRLYDVTLTFADDMVHSYFGLREVRLDGYRFLINGQSVFQRLVLDQGYFPDGIYTAPSDDTLENDIRLSLAVGFNGARMHEKVFEERYLYHADRLGYIVWGEYPDWGIDHSRPESFPVILSEWTDVITRDRNHPAIVGWCPHNETWDQDYRKQYEPGIAGLYDITKLLDPSRPCIDTSGNYHVKTDIYDIHDYEQDPAVFRKHYESLSIDGTLYDLHAERQTYRGEATFVSEYGGIRWAACEKDETQHGSWGYGDDVQNEEAFYERFAGLTNVLLDNPRMFGLCYTQLTDVEQEQNGLYTYDRQAKFNTARLHAILSRKATIESENSR